MEPSDENDHRVDDTLRMDHDLDLIECDAKQSNSLQDLERLVGERRRVDRDPSAHVPIRMSQSLRRSHALQAGRGSCHETDRRKQ